MPGWKQVIQGAFGMGPGGDGSYTGEEGFEVLVFKDQLYLGMEADNIWGARLWRSKAGVQLPSSQADWEEVAADGLGRPFGGSPVQNDHIDSLEEFKGFLYASTANRSGPPPAGTRLYRSPTGSRGSWTDAQGNLGAGFGDANNENFKDMAVIKGQLCGGTANLVNGAQVWCTTNGLDWQIKNQPGFGDPHNILIASSTVYSGSLYLGVENDSSGGSLWRTSDLQGWTQVFHSSDRMRVEVMDALNGQLYIAAGASDGRLRTDPPLHLYRSSSGEPGSWSETGQEIGAASAHNTRTIVDGATLFDGGLYMTTMNTTGGTQLWRTYGDGWEQLTQGYGGFGDPDNFAAELIPFNGYLYAWTSNYLTGQQVLRSDYPAAKYLILMIGDGQGIQQIEAGTRYSGSPPPFAGPGWVQAWTSTFPAGGAYDSIQAWINFTYVENNPADSAAAATALYSGVKTANGRLNISADGSRRLFTLGDKARLTGRSRGAVSSVYLSDAAPGGWLAHNDQGGNAFAVADEMLWGDPNATGSPVVDPVYQGGRGVSLPPPEVVVGGGHPDWTSEAAGNHYVTQTMVTRLRADSGQPGAFTFVERQAGRADGGARLLAAAADPAVQRLAGLFGGPGGNLEYRHADGQGANPEEPTLAEMARASLNVLARSQEGFSLLIEGGAIDWANHANRMDDLVGEELAFRQAVQAVEDWVDDPTTPADWSNTLLIVTADHESGYLTAGPGVFPDQPLGAVTTDTLRLEKPVAGGPRRASWQDTNQNGLIDPGETVYWAWNSGGHTNSLVPLYARGVGADWFARYATRFDPRRGAYLDDAQVFQVMDQATFNLLPPGPPITVTLPLQAK